MSEVVQIVILTTIAGASIPVGALLGTIDELHPDWLDKELRHSVIAFGGGVLLAAVSLVLVPDGVKYLPVLPSLLSFVLGGAAFWYLDVLLARSANSASQLVAMLSDFLPEAMALGAAFAMGGDTGPLLALLIALQNLPEGFNAFRELTAGGSLSRRRVLVVFVLLVPLGPLAGLAGYRWLGAHPAVMGAVMLFAAGGILYLTFEDIAPQSRLEHRTAPGLGSVFGFLVGLAGHLFL